ncbi:hypothetical protein ACHAQA_000809 [Verticillium albo-atrum]
MESAPFEGVPLAPKGATLADFDEFIAQTRELLKSQYPQQVITNEMLVVAVQARARAELDAMERMEEERTEATETTEETEEDLQMAGVIPDDTIINDSLAHGDKAQHWLDATEIETRSRENAKRARREDPVLALQHGMGDMYVRFSLIEALAQHTELAAEVGCYLEPRDLLNLYSVSRVFHAAISPAMTSTLRMWVRRRAPESGDIFSFRLYRDLCIRDPAGRTNAFGVPRYDPFDAVMAQVRHVPSLKWYQMVVLREDCVNDIVEALEDEEQPLPRGIESTLKKMWLLMDVATNKGRRAMIGNKALWTRADLYNVQLFLVKLSMHFCDPLWPERHVNTLVKLMLGQRGLYKLWQVLTGNGFTKLHDIVQLKVRYDYLPVHEQFRRAMFGESIYGVPAHDVGIVHLEAWGRGTGHLLRPDELIHEEALRRGFIIDRHIIYMILWGHPDIPEDELDELPNADIRESTTWAELTQAQRAELLNEDIDNFRSERQYLFARQTRTDRAAHLPALHRDPSPPIHPHDGIDLSALPNADDPSTWVRTVISPEPDSVSGSSPTAPTTLTPAIQLALDATARTTDADPDDDVRMHVYCVLFGPGIVGEQQEARADEAWGDWEAEDDDPEWRDYVDEINAPEDESFDQFDNLEFYDRQPESEGETESEGGR